MNGDLFGHYAGAEEEDSCGLDVPAGQRDQAVYGSAYRQPGFGIAGRPNQLVGDPSVACHAGAQRRSDSKEMGRGFPALIVVMDTSTAQRARQRFQWIAR